MNDFNFQPNQIVEYSTDTITGRGKVIGCASSPMPPLGRQYIVEDLAGNLPNSIYPFKVFVCFEAEMKSVDTKPSRS